MRQLSRVGSAGLFCGLVVGALLAVGLLGNAAILAWSIWDDPTSLLWCAGLIGVGVVLFLLEYFFGNQGRPSGAERGDPTLAKDRRPGTDCLTPGAAQ